jgi:hypothetical protein
VHRLGRLMTQGATLIDRLVGYAVDTLASRAEQRIAADGKLTAEQARAWVADLSNLPPLRSPAETVDFGERYFGLDTLQLGAYTSNARFAQLLYAMTADPSFSQPPPSRARFFYWNFIPVNYARTMRQANHVYDQLMAAMSLPTFPARREKLAAWNEMVGQLRPTSATALLTTSNSDVLLALLVPSLDKTNDRDGEVRAHAELARVAMALAAYRVEHGRTAFPQSLDALVPAMLPKAPVDPFVEKPLVYRPTAGGAGYVLYSVGPNMTDDGGAGRADPPILSAYSKEATPAEPDDLAVRAGDAATTSTAPSTTRATR